MPIPDYQTLMRPVLEQAAQGEVRVGALIETLAQSLDLTPEEREQLLPSGKQAVFANRVHWAKTYLKQAGLVAPTKRGHFIITARGKAALADPSARIDNEFLKQFDEFRAFLERSSERQPGHTEVGSSHHEITPDEALRAAHKAINDSLAGELLDRIRQAPPAFFERVLVSLFVTMGYGGSAEEAGRALGRSGDDGVDGVIDQDPLGVDQIYLQAKRYSDRTTVGPAAIRDFFGALSLKRATKGIFVTTSAFSTAAIETARALGSRIVLIDGEQLARLMLRYNIGCRDDEILYLKKVDEEYFEQVC